MYTLKTRSLSKVLLEGRSMLKLPVVPVAASADCRKTVFFVNSLMMPANHN